MSVPKADKTNKTRAKRPVKPTTTNGYPQLTPNAAGIDIATREVWVAVPTDRAEQPVRRFETFTRDYQALADWLTQCGVETVAMEATGVYWIPLFEILDQRGFELCLVNPRTIGHATGVKSDVYDCQRLQHLHACGLLTASFQPQGDVRALRAVIRQRASLVRLAASQVQHMQKSMDQMNLHLHHVISDITGVSGLAILDAIVSGEHDPNVLAGLCRPGISAPRLKIVKSLEGNYRAEHLLTLRQALTLWRQILLLMAECDAQIESVLAQFTAAQTGEASQASEASEVPQDICGGTSSAAAAAVAAGARARVARVPKRSEKTAVHLPHANLQDELARILGVDLTQVPGVACGTVCMLLSEIGPSLSAFPSVKHLSSWLGLCPDNRTSGGKVLSSKTRDVKSRLATALRMAALSVSRTDTALGRFYRKMRSRLGAPKAITATAHKLIRILYHLITTGESYNESVFAEADAREAERRIARLHREAERLGYTLSPTPAPA
jgi:transposase